MAQTSTSFAPASAGFAAGGNRAVQLVSKAFGWFAGQRRINRTVATLSNLSDATLKDIGIERGDIDRIARYGRGA
jgi:uncharacterized protein YjiS (DUF1127 family)